MDKENDEGGVPDGRLAPEQHPAYPEQVSLSRDKPDEPTLVSEVMQRLLDLMGLRGTVNLAREDDGYYAEIRVRRSGGLLIGHQGETLRALSYVTRMIVRRHYPGVPPVTADVGGYRQRRESFLCMKAAAVARIVIETGREMQLDELTKKEMRLVQQALVSEKRVRLHAVGDGIRRDVVICPVRS